MKITKMASGKYKLTKKSWDKIGQKTGWLKAEQAEQTEQTEQAEQEVQWYAEHENADYFHVIDQLPNQILHKFSITSILQAIKALGEERFAGFTNIKPRDVEEVIYSATAVALETIWCYLSKTGIFDPDPASAEQAKQIEAKLNKVISKNMKITKTASGKYKITKKSWDKIGQKTGWLDEEKEDMFGSAIDEYEDFEQPLSPLPGKILTTYSPEVILQAIKALGEEQIAGFRNVTEQEVKQIISAATPIELQTIWDYLDREPSFAADKSKMVKIAMGMDGQIQSYVKKVKTKAGKEFYALVLYGNTRPISGYLGKPSRGKKKQTSQASQEKLFFNYFQGTWSRIIPESFVTKVTTGEIIEDPKAAGFLKSIESLTSGFDVDGVLYKADLAPLYDASNYGEEVQTAQQSEISGMQKDIKESVMKAGKPAQKISALNMFIDAEIKRIREMTDEAAQSTMVKSFLAFAARFYNYSPRNQMLIWMQKPNATRVAGVHDWRNKSGREVIDWGDPITIIAPMSFKRKDENLSQDVSKWTQQGLSSDDISRKSRYTVFNGVSVFDISATQKIAGWTDKEGNPPSDDLGEWRQNSNDTVEEIEALVNASLKWAENNNIQVKFEELQEGLGGYSSGQFIAINNKFDGINKFSTLVHECAHEILHWEHDKGKNVRNMMGKTEGRMAKEIDAETTAFIVLQHYGFETPDAPNYLALWAAKGEDVIARKNNISDSVKIMIKGIDSAIKSVDMNPENVEKITEDEDVVKPVKNEIEQPEQVEQIEQIEQVEQIEPVKNEITQPKLPVEEITASDSDKDALFKAAMAINQKQQFKKLDDFKGNFFGDLGIL